ncbi:hypothetical protein PsAD13_04177 [Pseudovibrio sp. Ad13]|uniref:hypothetical protein n=1 Tax=Pseudovibrio sp. Ad13 TaxID=989396 RepID=UPI0007AEC278|nr:hypothetical protein [Pseudovibrio sp. Ad13]KZK81228.1 hypothetical protein PsAD13_04177 [Pseudovibrio sp. Ad13]
MGLYSDLLKRIQDANEYGGGAEIFLLRQSVFDAIDRGADGGDSTLIALRRDLLERLKKWVDVEDHEARSRLFETYCEATFYLSSAKHVKLEGIPRGPTNTPDFQTLSLPHVRFEIKTLDIADPIASYGQQMNEGLEGRIEATKQAQHNSIGFGEQSIAPHGLAETWPEVIEQTMRKLSGNIKQGQYTDAPTFLVANLGRLCVRVNSEQLNKTSTISAVETFDGLPADVSGHLWTIANHVPETDFSWLDPIGQLHSTPIMQAGLLRDYPFIQGIIFTTEPWSEFEEHQDWRASYAFLGVWNRDCTSNFDMVKTDQARSILEAICMHIVDTC